MRQFQFVPFIDLSCKISLESKMWAETGSYGLVWMFNNQTRTSTQTVAIFSSLLKILFSPDFGFDLEVNHKVKSAVPVEFFLIGKLQIG